MQYRTLFLIGLIALAAGCRGGARQTASRPVDPASAPLHADAGDLGARPNAPYGANPDSANPAGGRPSPGQSLAAGGRAPVNAPAGTNGRRGTESFNAVAEHLSQGRVEVGRGNLEQAQLHYRRVLQDEPDNVEAHHRLAVIADKGKQFDEADRHYRAALRVQPSDANLLSDMGYSQWLQGKYAEAERTLQEALRVEPGHERAINNLGLVYGSQRNYSKALAMFRMTGSESEAQAKMARLFPNAVPAESLAAAGEPDPRTGAAPPGAPGTNLAAGEASRDITQQIKLEMDRARREAETRRKRPQGFAGGPPNRSPPPSEGLPASVDSGYSDQRPESAITDPQLAETARILRLNGPADQPRPDMTAGDSRRPSPIDRPPPTIDPGRPLHPSQINMAFEEIDRRAESDLRTHRVARPTPSMGDHWPPNPQSAQYAGGNRPSNGVWPPDNSARTTNGMHAGAEQVWSPNPSMNEEPSPQGRVERADYYRESYRAEAAPYRRDPAAADPRRPANDPYGQDAAMIRRDSRMSPEDAQRVATRIGMDAGPGGPFALSEPDSRPAAAMHPANPTTPLRQSPGAMTQGAPYGQPVREMRPGRPGYETPREFVDREQDLDPQSSVPRTNQYGRPAAPQWDSRSSIRQAKWDGGPGPVPDEVYDVHAGRPEEGVRYAGGAIDHHQRDRQLHDSEYNALMQGMDRERMANEPLRPEALPSMQYYTGADPSLRPYEQMQQRIRPEAASASARPGMGGTRSATVWDGSPYGAAPPNNASPAGPSPWGSRPGGR